MTQRAQHNPTPETPDLNSDEQPGIHPDAVPEMEVCHACAKVVGPFYQCHLGYRVQYGSCRDHTMPEAVDTHWPRYDYNLHVDLCRCCGRVPLRSGSKWSVWFCEACKEQVGLLNGRHDRCVVPIGRHSVHSGHLLSGDQVRNPVAVETFFSSMKSIFAVHGPLADWMREAVHRNFRDVGLPVNRPVPLARYWAEVRGGIDPDARFREMCAYLAEVSQPREGR
jgi:hypothetical protein